MKHESGYDFNETERILELHCQMAVASHNKIEAQKFFAAVGRLASWGEGSPRYKFVVITHDRFDGDLIANYYPSKESRERRDRPAFQMGAVWHRDTKEYSFHS